MQDEKEDVEKNKEEEQKGTAEENEKFELNIYKGSGKF